MSEEIIRIKGDARFKFRSDTAVNWKKINPILLSGEAGVVTGLNRPGDGLVKDSEKVKIGDGIHNWNELGWWRGPKGEKGTYTLSDEEKAEIMGVSLSALHGNTTFVFDGGDASSEAKINYIIDNEMSDYSSNLVPNKVIKKYVDEYIKLHILNSPDGTQDIAILQIKDKNVLIDSGSPSSAKYHLQLIRDTLGITKIDYIYITHFHYDHAGGLSFLSSGDEEVAGLDMTNAVIYLPETPPDSFKTAYPKYLSGIEPYIDSVNAVATEKNMTVIIPTDEEHIFYIENLQLDFRNYNTAQYYDGNIESVDYNNSSLCCIMTYGKTRFGFFGDINIAAQENLTGTIGHLDLMSVEHHGWNKTQYKPFYDSITPKMCFTQEGAGYGIVSNVRYFISERSKSYAYLQENNIPNYVVSVNGTITFNIHKTGVSTEANAVQYDIPIADDRLNQQIYPIGSIWLGDKKDGVPIDPADLFGGAWELFDKEFHRSRKYISTIDELKNYVEWGTYEDGTEIIGTNANVSSLCIERAGHSITITAFTAFDNNYNADDLIELFTINETAFGISLTLKSDETYESVIYPRYVAAIGDQGNSISMVKVNVPDNTTGKIVAQYQDKVPQTATTNIGDNVNFTVMLDLLPKNMHDDFCDKFYWKRTG